MKIAIAGTGHVGLSNGITVIKYINKFKTLSDVIVANRLEDAISGMKEKVYTRDIFGSEK